MARIGPRKADEKDAEDPEAENRQPGITVFLEKVGEKDKDQNGEGHGLDDLVDLVRQGRESFGPVKTGRMKHGAAYEKDDDKKREVLSPGGDILRDPDESRIEPQQVRQEPGQRNKEEVQEKQKSDEDLIVFF